MWQDVANTELQSLLAWMGMVSRFFASAELLPLIMIALLLGLSGSRWSNDTPGLRDCGRCLGFVSALIFVAQNIAQQEMNDSQLLFEYLLRGFVLHLTVQGIVQLILRTLSQIVSATIHPVLARVRHNLTEFTRAICRVRREITTRKHGHGKETRSRDPLEHERMQQAEAQRVKKGTAEKERIESERRRREEAQLRSDLLYERHARQLAASFPRDRFDQFIDRYMGGATDPQLVEQREQLLKEMIVDSLGTTLPPRFISMNELAAFFAARREEINGLPHSDEVKDAYIVQLNKLEDDALRRFLKP